MKNKENRKKEASNVMQLLCRLEIVAEKRPIHAGRFSFLPRGTSGKASRHSAKETL